MNQIKSFKILIWHLKAEPTRRNKRNTSISKKPWPKNHRNTSTLRRFRSRSRRPKRPFWKSTSSSLPRKCFRKSSIFSISKNFSTDPTPLNRKFSKIEKTMWSKNVPPKMPFPRIQMRNRTQIQKILQIQLTQSPKF